MEMKSGGTYLKLTEALYPFVILSFENKDNVKEYCLKKREHHMDSKAKRKKINFQNASKLVTFIEEEGERGERGEREEREGERRQRHVLADEGTLKQRLNGLRKA